MILPVRRGGLDRQQRKYPFARRKKISRKEGESPRKKEIPLRLSYFASLREQKKEYLHVRRSGLDSQALRLRKKKNRSRKEGKTQRSRPLYGFASRRLSVNKKECLAKKRRRKDQDPFASLNEEKKISRKEGESPRKKEIPLRLSYFASLREQKKEYLHVRRSGLDSQALRLREKKNRSRKEGKTQRSRPLCGFASRRLSVNKKE